MATEAQKKPLTREAKQQHNVSSERIDCITDQAEMTSNTRYPGRWHPLGVRRRISGGPEYLIRTGSMKSKRMKRGITPKHSEYMTIPGSHYARYLLQAGCFFWQGRFE